MKNIELSVEQAKQLYLEHPEWRDTVLSNFSDVELDIKPQFPISVEKLDPIDGWWIDVDSCIKWTDSITPPESLSMFATPEQARSALAFAQLSQLAKVMNQGWEHDWNGEMAGWTVEYHTKDKLCVDIYWLKKHHITFKTKELAEFSLERHRQLWEDYWMI